jgi:hypothetical protein
LELVTTTLTPPAVWTGVVTVIEVLLTNVTLVAAVPPKVTVAPEAKFVPVIVTSVPPLTDPELGETEVSVGFAVYVYPLLSDALWSFGLVTNTVTAPAVAARVIAVMEVLLTTVTSLASVPPNVAAAPETKFVPVMVTKVPPLSEPDEGETDNTVGRLVVITPDSNVVICMTQFPEPLSGAVAL